MYKKTFTLCTQASLICLSAFIHVYVCPLNHYSSIYHHFTHSKPSLIFQFIYLVFIPLSVQDFTHLSIHPVFSISLSIQPLLIFLSTQSLLICISNQPSFYVVCDIHSPVCSPSLNSLRSVTQMMYEIQMSALPLETVVFGRDNFQCFLLVQAIFMTDDQVFPG